MDFIAQNLEKALKATGLPYRSMPFIHGALTAHIITPYCGNDDEEDAIICAAIFDVQNGDIPEKGKTLNRMTRVLECVDAIQGDIIDDLQDGRYEPYFGQYPKGTPGTEIAREWCNGFLAATFLGKEFPDREETTKEAATAFGMLMAYAQSDDEDVLEKIKPLSEDLLENPEAIVSDCVYEIDFFWREWEAKHESEDGLDDDFTDLPLTREEPKTGRNDPCPCGSGKKFKKCCGKNGDSISKSLSAISNREKAGHEKLLSGLSIGPPDKTSGKKCFICGKTKNLVKTPCCEKWICDDEDQYVLFSYARNSCLRNHRRYTLCGQHFDAGHDGDWKTCTRCRKELSKELEMYIWYGTNEYNHEKLPDPPAFTPSFCAKCRKRIILADGGYTVKAGKYYCDRCEPLVMPDFS
jgi:uncharacterized protein YecA (UPF0149 family)